MVVPLQFLHARTHCMSPDVLIIGTVYGALQAAWRRSSGDCLLDSVELLMAGGESLYNTHSADAGGIQAAEHPNKQMLRSTAALVRLLNSCTLLHYLSIVYLL